MLDDIKAKMVGKVFKHFKGNYYTVLNVARHSETKEVLVVYSECSNPENVWVRPYEMFTSKVDKVKYPNVTQEYRFEEVC